HEHADDVLTVRLATSVDSEDIESVLCFVVDAEQLSITRQIKAEAAPQAPAVKASDAASTDAKPSAKRNSGERSGKESGSLRVATDKVDQIINLVGELVITQSMLEQNTADLDAQTHGKLVEGLSQLERTARD